MSPRESLDIKCQSRSWSQRGTKVDGSRQPATQTNRDLNRDKTLARSDRQRTSETYRHSFYSSSRGVHEDKLCDILQAMAPTNMSEQLTKTQRSGRMAVS